VTTQVELLRGVPLFRDLDQRELEHLARSLRERRFNAGQTVAAEGEHGVGFFIIEEGKATVYVRGVERRELGPGDHFGEVALIDDGARTATIIADTELRCQGLTSWDFRPLVEANASVAWKLLQAMAAMLRAAQEREA
jgi:CRP-like cAMP-binding protein